MAKIDMRLLPVLCVLYLLAFLDRYVLLFVVLGGGESALIQTAGIITVSTSPMPPFSD